MDTVRCAALGMGDGMSGHNCQMAKREHDRIELVTRPDIDQFTAVDDRNFRVDFVTYMSMLWEEPRIVYTGNASVPKTVSLGLDMAQHIWLPDIYIYNLKSVKMTSILREFAGKDRVLEEDNIA